MFKNREDAARQLAARLMGRGYRNPLVLAIPRGGVVTGAVLARELDRLLVSRRSLQYEYVPRFEAILHGPEHLTLPLLRTTRAGWLSLRRERADQRFAWPRRMARSWGSLSCSLRSRAAASSTGCSSNPPGCAAGAGAYSSTMQSGSRVTRARPGTPTSPPPRSSFWIYRRRAWLPQAQRLGLQRQPWTPRSEPGLRLRRRM